MPDELTKPDEQTLTDRISNEQKLMNWIFDSIGRIERNAVRLFHQRGQYSGTFDELRSGLDAAIDEVVRVCAQLQQTDPSHYAVRRARDCLISLYETHPQESITVGMAYRANGLKMEARNAMERAAKNVDPAFWDDVAELERELGNPERAGYIWRKIIEAWDGKEEYDYALKFARKLGDEILIAKYERLAGTPRRTSEEQES